MYAAKRVLIVGAHASGTHALLCTPCNCTPQLDTIQQAGSQHVPIQAMVAFLIAMFFQYQLGMIGSNA